MNKEEILINLKILQSLQKNQKLISRGPYMNIEPISIIPEFIRRWHRQDSRNETLLKINMIVNSAIELIEHWKTRKINENDIDNILHYMEQSITGIKNLKETYATCSQTCARIDVVVNKVNDCLACHQYHETNNNENKENNENNEIDNDSLFSQNDQMFI